MDLPEQGGARSGRLRALIERFSGPSVIVFIGSAASCVLEIGSVLSSTRLKDSYFEATNETLTALVCLCIMLSCSLLFLLLRSRRSFVLALALKLVALLLYADAKGALGEGEAGVLLSSLLEIAIYEAFGLNLALCGATTAAFLLVCGGSELGARGSPPGLAASAAYALSSHGPALAALSLVSGLACMLVYYREKCIDQAERISRLDRVIERLSSTNMGYQSYAHEAAARSQLEERMRITRELHDIVGYTFTNNIMMMEAAVTKIGKDPLRVQQLIGLARENAKAGLEKIRSSLYMLRSTESRRTPSLERISSMIKVFEVATQVEVRTDFGNLAVELDEEVERFIYSFTQEALTNAFLHGGATRIDVSLNRDSGGITASVRDNGGGAISIEEGIGISGMRERLAHLRGELSLRDTGAGFEIVGRIPLPEESPEGGEVDAATR